MAKKKTGSVVDTERYRYDRMRVPGPDGRIRQSATNGDAVARALAGTDHADHLKIMRANKLTESLGDLDGKMNNGQFRMALGHSLRRLVREGTPVTIGSHTVKTLSQRVALPDVKAATSKKGRRKKAA